MITRLIGRFFSNYKVKAGIYLLLAGFILASLISYDPSDIAFNVASNNAPSNYMSSPGAYLSDWLYQMFGLVAFVLPLVFISWAVVTIRNQRVSLLPLRILAFFICLFTSVISFSLIEYDFLPANGGGFLGKLLFEKATQVATSINASLEFDIIYSEKTYVLFIASFVSLLMLYLSLAISNQTYKKFISGIFKAISYPFVKFGIFQSIADKISRMDSGEAYYASDGMSSFEEPYSEEGAPPRSPASRKPKRSYSSDKDEARPSKKAQKSSDSSQAANIIADGGTASLPDIDLLDEADKKNIKQMSRSELDENAEKLMSVLNDFGIKGNILNVRQGPVVTLYEFEPAAGTKSSRVIGLADDIARSLSALSTRIAVIPGRNALGIELPNKKRMFFRLKELVETEEFQDDKYLLPLILGKDLGGSPYVADLAKMPHLLVAGTTGSGKSVAINAMIMSLLYKYRPDECKMIMIDPKMLELSAYDNIPHLLTPVVTEPGKAVVALKWAVKEMENRYRLMSHLGVRNIAGYNAKIMEAMKSGKVLERTVQTGFDPETGKPIYEKLPIEMEKMPYIVIIVDEMADLMLVAGKDIESSVQRLAQMARAAGLHIIMATQRPSVDVITGVIKANFPSRISFRVTSKIDSRTILGEQGSEQLLGMGDMLFMGSTSRILRVHGPFVDDAEVERVTNFLRSSGVPNYVSAVTEDSEDESMEASGNLAGGEGGSGDLYSQAVEIVKTQRKSSISYIQRSLRIGYNKAANLVDEMERNGVLSPPNHSGKREILLPEE